MSTSHVVAITLRACVVLAISVVLVSACGGRGPSTGSHPASATTRPVSCRQQFENWKHGPARAGTVRTVLKQIQAAEQSGDVTGMRAAMRQLVPVALVMANHPMPHCSDPASLYPKLVTRIYAVGASARSAHGLSSLQEATAALDGLNRLRRRQTAEINRTMGQGPFAADSSPSAG